MYALAGIQLPKLSYIQAGNSAVGEGSTFRWTLLDKIFLENLMVTNPVNNVPTLIEREELTPYLQTPINEPRTTHNINSTQFTKIHFNILPPMPFSDNYHFHLVLSTKNCTNFYFILNSVG